MDPTKYADRNNRIAENIRAARAARQVGLRQLAANIHDDGYSISHSALHRIEQGQKSPTIEELFYIAGALETDVTVLLRGAAKMRRGDMDGVKDEPEPGVRIADMLVTPDVRGAINEMTANVLTPDVMEAIQGDVRELMTKVVLEGALREFADGVFEQKVGKASPRQYHKVREAQDAVESEQVND